MSAFLGPIHSWLFRKIKFQDELTKSLLEFVVQKEYKKELVLQVDERYGTLEEGELVDIIDESNIHGWLQDRISVVEKRLAFVVTAAIEGHPERMLDINDAVYEFGKKHALEHGISAKEAYRILDDLLLNGMPCDRVNEVVRETPDSIVWRQTVDIHATYWDMVRGNPDYYYAIRESLILGITEKSGILYDQIKENTFELRKAI